MANIICQADAERVLRIIESLFDHVPEHVKFELESLKGLLKSPLFYQYLDYQELQKISELSENGVNIEEFCEQVQNMKLSELQIEDCSNINYTDECDLDGDTTEPIDKFGGDETLVCSPSNTIKQEDTLEGPSPAPSQSQNTSAPLQNTPSAPSQKTPDEDTSLVLRDAVLSGDDRSPTSDEFRTKRKVSIKRETITLNRVAGESLGFDVAGTVVDEGGVEGEVSGAVRVFVEKIKPGGLAERDGRLRAYDEIIAINGEYIIDNVGGPEAMQQVLNKIDEQTGSVVFTVKRKIVDAPSSSSTGVPQVNSKEVPPRPHNPLSLVHRKIIIEPDGSVMKLMPCNLVNNGTGLGFGIVDDVYGNVKINTILPEGVAHKEGTLRLQDVILEINEAMVRGLNQQQIAGLLQTASPNVALIIGRVVDLGLEKITTGLEGVVWTPISRCLTTGGIKVHGVPQNCPIQHDDVIIQANDINVELLEESQICQLFAAAKHVTIYRVPANQEISEEFQNGIKSYEIDKIQKLSAIWKSEMEYIEFEKTNATLGLSISPLIDPLKPTRTVIVIDHVQEESGLVGRVEAGSKLTSINDHVFNDCSFDIVARVMKTIPSGPVRLGITSLAVQPLELTDDNGNVISHKIITVCNNSDFPGITLKPSPRSCIPGFVVCSILPGGLFHVDGRLKPGDIIVTINYAETARMGLRDIRSMIETSSKNSTLLRVSYVSQEDTLQEYTVCVPRHPKTGIGIVISGGATPDKPNHPIYIKKIVDIKSPLRRGEHILKVNDMSLVGMTHDEAVDVIKTSTSPLTLTLQTPIKQGSKSEREKKNHSAESEDVLLMSLPIDLSGLKLGTCEKGLVVSHVDENMLGEATNLKEGDIIFKVHDTILRGVPQDMMLPILRQQDGPTNVTVVRKPPRKAQVTPINTAVNTPVTEPKIDHKPTTPLPLPVSSPNSIGNGVQHAFTVHIKKSGTTSLGINVVQKGSGIFVKNIVPDFPASQCDNLRPGDRILAVNEHPLTEISRIKAIAVLRKVEGDVTLLLTRPNVAVAHVTSSTASCSDKENPPSSRSISPFVEQQDRIPSTTSSIPRTPQQRSTPSTPQQPPSSQDMLLRDPALLSASHPDISPLRRTDFITADNISLRSHQPDLRFSNQSSRNSLDKLPDSPQSAGFQDIERPDYPLLPSHDSYTPTGGSVAGGSVSADMVGPDPIYSVVMKKPKEIEKARQSDVGFTGQSDAVLNRPLDDSVRADGSGRSSPVLPRQTSTEREPISSDRRISWHDTPIEVDMVTLTLHNSDSGSGIILISQPHPDGILVKSITSNSPAQQLVWPQDLITRINDVVTRDMAVSDAAILLSEKKATIEIEIKRDSPLYQIQNVTLDKPKSGSLGLSITERRSLPGIYISKITPGGAVEKQGGLWKGQRILAINGADVKYTRQPQFISILKGCGGKIELTVGAPLLDSEGRSITSSRPHSPGSLRMSTHSARGSLPSRGSPYSSQRSLHSIRGLIRQSPPASPHGSPLFPHRSSPHGSSSSPQGGSPCGSPRGSFRGAPVCGSPRDSRSTQHSGFARGTGPPAARESVPGLGSSRNVGFSHQDASSGQRSGRDYHHEPLREYEQNPGRNYDLSHYDRQSSGTPQYDRQSSGTPQYDRQSSGTPQYDRQSSGTPHGSHRDYPSHHGSHRDNNNMSPYGGSQRDFTNSPSPHPSASSPHPSASSPLLSSSSPHPISPRPQREFTPPNRDFAEGYYHMRESPVGSQRDLAHQRDNIVQNSSQRDLASHHSSQRELLSQRDLSSQREYQIVHHESQRDLASHHSSSQRDLASHHSSQRDLASHHSSQRDYNTGSRAGSHHRDTDSLRSSQHSSRHRQARHPSPSRSHHSSTLSKRSNISERELRSETLQSDYKPGSSVATMSTHSIESLDSRSRDLPHHANPRDPDNPREHDKPHDHDNPRDHENPRDHDNPQLEARSNSSSSSGYNKPKPPILRTANLYREKNAPLGLSLGGGKGWPLGSIPLFISFLQEDGIAARSGVLRVKDRIVSINGTNVEDFTHQDAVRILREATSPVTLVVTDPDTNRPDFKMVKWVKLTRSPDGFGFTIVGGRDNVPALPITIKHVYEEGPAYGNLKRGDQIISVNGKSIEDYTREDATLLLKSCTETVTLVIQ